MSSSPMMTASAVLSAFDDRLPFPWTKNDGVYPYWVKRHGMPPTLTVPYAEACREGR